MKFWLKWQKYETMTRNNYVNYLRMKYVNKQNMLTLFEFFGIFQALPWSNLTKNEVLLRPSTYISPQYFIYYTTSLSNYAYHDAWFIYFRMKNLNKRNMLTLLDFSGVFQVLPWSSLTKKSRFFWDSIQFKVLILLGVSPPIYLTMLIW